MAGQQGARLLVFWSVAAMASPAAAQEPGAVPDLSRWQNRTIHETWTVRDGLPVNSVNHLIQSRDGYLWAATFDGLVRFDGVRFTVFNPATQEGLTTGRILRLLEGVDGTLWLTTDRSLVQFRDGRFREIGPAEGLTGNTLGVYEDATGRIWVMTSDALGWIRGDRFVPVVGVPPGEVVTALIQRADGGFWAGTRGAGLYRLEGNPDGGEMRAVLVDYLDAATVRVLFEDPSGRLWIGTAAHGIWSESEGVSLLPMPDPPLQEVTHFVHSAERGATFAIAASGNYQVEEHRVRLIDSRPWVALPGRPMAVDPDGALWHASGSRLARDGRPVLDLGPDPGDPLSGAMITAMVVDHEGSVWTGTRAAGLHRIKPSFITTLSEPEGITHRNVYPIQQDSSGEIWVGSYGNGLSRIHRDGSITNYTPDMGYPTLVYSLLADRADRLWVGGMGALLRCRLPEMTCTQEDPTVVGTTAHAFHRDAGGRLWAGFPTGPRVLKDEVWAAVPDWPDAGTVRAFAETGDGAIWMGTDGGGLVRYENGRFTQVTEAGDGLPINLVRALYLDADGWLWVGTQGRGLARLDPLAWKAGSGRTDRRIVSIRAAHGLFDEMIHQILEDDAGRLWMSTNRGIFWVAREDLNAFAEGGASHVRSTGYTERDGLRHREANGGMQPAGIRDRDGRLWFPTQDGVAVVDPKDITTHYTPPPVVVERITASDSTVLPGSSSVEFGVKQRDLQVEYTALSFLEPANVQFRYRLDPYDPDWVEAGPRRTAFYTKVPPGRYTFRVMASNEPDVWPGAAAEVEILLEPRFRETRGAFLLALVALTLMVGGGYRWRVGNLRRTERELSRVVEVRTEELRRHQEVLHERNVQLATQAEALADLHQARSRLFANLTHEFRTPLTLILGPLKSLQSGRHGVLDVGVREQHQLMLRSSERLLRLINQILDLSKIQAGALSLEPRVGDVTSFARDVTMACTSLMERRGLALEFNADAARLFCPFDPEHLETILYNLLSNAAKFTETGGSVAVEVRELDGWAEITVRDTGIGIRPEETSRIFERFHQSDASPTRRFAGTGIGLALAKELVEMHEGSITVESAPGKGSTFTVRLPRAEESAVADAPVSPDRGVPQDRVDAPWLDGAPQVSAAKRAPPPGEEPDDRATVLVVDDNPDVRAYLHSLLDQTYRVIDARDGEEGLAVVREALPDLVVADVMMPGLDGLALGRELKTDPMTDAIPLILLTARAEPQDHVAGLTHGADAYLVKPFDPDVLQACVASLLAKRSLLRERFRQGEVPLPTTCPETPAPLDARLRPLVEARLVDPALGPDALAADAGLSYHQLYRALRDELGVTPSGFIRRIRVECAAALLRQGAGSVTEIAYSVGFESLSYFRRAFHERFNASPTEHLAAQHTAADPQV
jgi:signal transduction histidine kinase/ligand-binding sensor domain-containing protein/CheY-like chemotaxis protein/AraC-like DNA-binding protein